MSTQLTGVALLAQSSQLGAKRPHATVSSSEIAKNTVFWVPFETYKFKISAGMVQELVFSSDNPYVSGSLRTTALWSYEDLLCTQTPSLIGAEIHFLGPSSHTCGQNGLIWWNIALKTFEFKYLQVG